MSTPSRPAARLPTVRPAALERQADGVLRESGDRNRFLSLLAEDVMHDISGGAREVGREAFSRFMRHMDRCYRE